MSENLDLVRSICVAWERGDFSSADWADPEIEFAFVDGPEPGCWTGLQEMSARYGDWLAGLEPRARFATGLSGSRFAVASRCEVGVRGRSWLGERQRHRQPNPATGRETELLPLQVEGSRQRECDLGSR
jgi:hypothetical protein